MMAYLEVETKENTLVIKSQVFCYEIRDTWVNRKVVFILLRILRNPETGKPLFTYQCIAEAFGYADRRNIHNFWQEFQHSVEDFASYLRRKRKVTAEVVEALVAALSHDLLADKEALARAVNQRLKRQDISAANVEAGLAQISCAQIRRILKQQVAAGGVPYKEQFLLQELLSQVSPAAALGQRASLEGESSSAGMKRSDPTAIRKLLTPHVALEEVSPPLCLLVFVMTLWWWGVPLSVLGAWGGVHKTTILRQILGLAWALWPYIQSWLQTRIKAGKVYLDEKWIKIRGVWYYWYVVLDVDTDLPILQVLLATRSEAAVESVVAQLRQRKKLPSLMITDGLAAYQTVFSKLDEVRHVLCRFHHQQGVTRWVKQHFSDKDERKERQHMMKRVFQTSDKRPVTRRLTRLKARAAKWGIEAWVTLTETKLPHLLPSVGSRRIPSTTNAIERVFRAFQRFYKLRCGFHSVISARRALIVFLVVYLFTRGHTGTAPIELIVPEASQMPLYRLMNDPFPCLKIFAADEPQHLTSVKPIDMMADFLTTEAAAA
jgi:transposase-like protein